MGIEIKTIGGSDYQEISYNYRGSISMQEAASIRRQWEHMDAYYIEPSPDYICNDNLNENDVVAGTEGIASQFSPEHFLVLPLKPDILHIANAFDYYVINHPEKRFLVTKVFCGMVGMTPEVVAPAFARMLWYGNVRLPADFIDILAKEPYHFKRKGLDLSPAQNDALYKWKNGRKVQRIQNQYGNIFSVLSRDRVGEVSRMLCAADEGEYMSVEFINTIRNAMQDFFTALHESGFILRTSDKITECGKEISMMQHIPDHIRTFTFSLIGIVNGGSHPNYYRRMIGQGDYKYLIKSLSYMLISVIEWWSAGFPMLDDEDLKRPLVFKSEHE